MVLYKFLYVWTFYLEVFFMTRVCMQTHLKPKQDHSHRQHSGKTIRSLVIPGGNPAKLLQAVDQPLHLIALPVQPSIKRSSRMLIFLSRDGRSNPSPVQVLAIFPKGIAFIARHSLGTDAQMTIPAPDRPLFHELLGHGDLVLLAGR